MTLKFIKEALSKWNMGVLICPRKLYSHSHYLMLINTTWYFVDNRKSRGRELERWKEFISHWETTFSTATLILRKAILTVIKGLAMPMNSFNCKKGTRTRLCPQSKHKSTSFHCLHCMWIAKIYCKEKRQEKKYHISNI